MEMLTPEESRTAVRLARNAIEKAVGGERMVLPALPPIFGEKRGVFVTIKRGGNLRGCIGLPYPIKPLGEAIVEAAVSAALEDPRFPPVSRSELADLDLEVTVLTVPRPLECPPQERPACVEVGKHGLIVSGLGTGGLLLPQVPTEYGWTSREFLDQTCVKAGLRPGCWRRNDVAVQTFEGQIFEEKAV
ncbi:MAG: TIGR00296 family protein [Methanoculleus sp.]|uniref:TIGR00296 family protein n=1 Tax=unclassified Methanoculleus TaxID=2619537 RepID=UPI0025DB65E7|nr:MULTISPECIES: TIGR00296 family protein [unclassified Methanoculleus]MCK9317118.1 TIGR00296 family protein [Methanoculleus sp.]MDD2253392.1 TIGR00296 family protein [Methanoculleus sp.]MDD3215029.1 TIGR00296 family protein [Methanoculleus sp.]MDD4314003.1 TIGR00296 family protein [Methanoculleus sp.]MDD4470262.1 TIGR00296 family protein [Methanoculleus sp.]